MSICEKCGMKHRGDERCAWCGDDRVLEPRVDLGEHWDADCPGLGEHRDAENVWLEDPATFWGTTAAEMLATIDGDNCEIFWSIVERCAQDQANANYPMAKLLLFARDAAREQQIQKLQLGPGDILVIKAGDRPIDPDTARRIADAFNRNFPDNKCMVISGGLEIAAVLAAGMTPNEQRKALGHDPIISLPPS